MDLDTLGATEHFAASLLGTVPPGALLILTGPLGAGKTTLVQALGRQLGSRAHITSPTYTLVHEYPSPQGPLVHIDAYRLPSADALIDLGLDDYLARARLVAAEWGEGLLSCYPEAVQVELSFTQRGRRAEVWARGRALAF